MWDEIIYPFSNFNSCKYIDVACVIISQYGTGSSVTSVTLSLLAGHVTAGNGTS